MSDPILLEVTNKEIKDLDKDLTFKQKAFFKRWLETGNGTKSALEVYDTEDPKVASVIASENLAKLREPIRTYMEVKGLSLGLMINVLAQGLTAKNKDGEPNHLVRPKYLDTALKLYGIKDTQTAIQINNFIPILGKEEVHVIPTDNGNNENTQANETVASSSGGNVSE